MKDIEDLKKEADGLGISYNRNIGAEKLAKKIDDFYAEKESADIVQSVDDLDVEDSEPANEVSKPEAKVNGVVKQKMAIHERRRKAMETHVVRITSNDKRDNEFTTTAYLGFENQHFGISRIVPLDIPVELEQCLIDIAKATMITLHKDEMKDGKRTGNKIPVPTRKYNVSYEGTKKK